MQPTMANYAAYHGVSACSMGDMKVVAKDGTPYRGINPYNGYVYPRIWSRMGARVRGIVYDVVQEHLNGITDPDTTGMPAELLPPEEAPKRREWPDYQTWHDAQEAQWQDWKQNEDAAEDDGEWRDGGKQWWDDPPTTEDLKKEIDYLKDKNGCLEQQLELVWPELEELKELKELKDELEKLKDEIALGTSTIKELKDEITLLKVGFSEMENQLSRAVLVKG